MTYDNDSYPTEESPIQLNKYNIIYHRTQRKLKKITNTITHDKILSSQCHTDHLSNINSIPTKSLTNNIYDALIFVYIHNNVYIIKCILHKNIQ